nr:serine protease [Streptomyces sp. BA2]
MLIKRGTLFALLASAAIAFPAAPAAHAIVNGDKASEAYPFMGSLQRPDSPRPDGHVCGAALIAKQWMVTAGHCVRGGKVSAWKVRIGSPQVDKGGELIGVKRAVAHPDGAYGGDIALLQLKKPARATPVQIASHAPKPGTGMRILGWGLTCSKNAASCWPKDLRELDTKRLADRTCADSGLVPGKELCIASVNGRGPANMDSGGPALVKTKGGWTLVGATSGSGGTTGVDPTVYTNVSAKDSWIKSVVNP